MSEPRVENVWAVLPAAGAGRRMNAPRPKQYLTVAGRPVIEWALQRILAAEFVSGAIVVIAPDDPFWREFGFRLPKPVYTVAGGGERFQSVANGLRELRRIAGEDAWALVHDAVRPCVTATELTRLYAAVSDAAPDGALLALPVRDTLKQAGVGRRTERTVDRSDLWQALTPQLFPLRALLPALEAVLQTGEDVTDEAQAMELAGYAPALVPGAATNIKLTHPEDLALLSLLLKEAEATLP